VGHHNIAHIEFPEDEIFTDAAILSKEHVKLKIYTNESGWRYVVLLLFDTIPALVILLNTAEISISQDLDPDATHWKVLENVWVTCYTIEFIAKMLFFGHLGYFFGPDRYWNWFDVTCLALSFVEFAITSIFNAADMGSGGAMGILKMMRLCRLARLIRALHYSVFDELKQMVLGVIAGLRVLFWAIVLLFICILIVGIIVRTLMGEDEPELGTVPNAMMTAFRCYTDGCTTYSGTPLQARLFATYGGVFMVLYILSFMFITVGVFNLIMATFLENVVSSGNTRRLEELGRTSPDVMNRIVKVTWLIMGTYSQNHSQSYYESTVDLVSFWYHLCAI